MALEEPISPPGVWPSFTRLWYAPSPLGCLLTKLKDKWVLGDQEQLSLRHHGRAPGLSGALGKADTARADTLHYFSVTPHDPGTAGQILGQQTVPLANVSEENQGIIYGTWLRGLIWQDKCRTGLCGKTLKFVKRLLNINKP